MAPSVRSSNVAVKLCESAFTDAFVDPAAVHLQKHADEQGQQGCQSHVSCKEELMRNTDAVVWGLNGSNSSPKLDTGQQICEKLWSALNSRICNVCIVIFVFAEGIVILSELLINLGVVQDPEWRIRNTNCSQNSSLLPNDISPKLKKAKEVFTYCSLSFLLLFVLEVFDAIVVLIAFGLDITFYLTPVRNGAGKKAAVLVILLRLWRINRIIQSIINASKAKLGNIISAYQKEKAHSEQKVDLLILKVEDLEHEVAYLKEKIKKAEKEPLFIKRRRTKDGAGGSSGSTAQNPLSKPTSITINIEPNLSSNISSPLAETVSVHSHSPLLETKIKDKVDTFAENAAAVIVDEALLLASYLWPADTVMVRSEPVRCGYRGSKLRRRPDGSFESGYGSAASSINWNKVRENFRADQEKQTVPLSVIRSTHRCPESSPESGYGSGGSHNVRNSSASPKDNETESADLSSGHSKQSGSVFLFPECTESKGTDAHDVQLDILDEITEIERVKNVEFDPHRHDKNIPMTSL